MPPYQVFCDPMVLRRIFSGLPDGRGMTTVDEISLSPASDCNSNNVAGSYNSTTSDAEFVQDNSDYQWFTEYGYSGREFCHRSVLSSGYDELARDLDSQLALADMEDFSAQEILSTLPTICCTEIQPERQGEMYASVSGSMMDESVSMSEPLFSPIKENPLPCTTNYSVDSLDCDCEDLVLTCQATNKDNYTIAFHGSGEGGDSLYFEERERGMAASTTTWSKVVKPRGNQQRHKSKAVSLPDLPTHPQHLSNSIAALGRCVKLFDIQNSGSLTSESYSGSGGDINSCFNKQENFSLLKLFIAQRNQTENTHNDNDNRNNNPADWEESGCQYEDSLVKGESTGASTEESSSVERLFSDCKSDSVCTCSMSSSSHKYNVNNNDSFEKDVVVKKHNVKVGTSTSDLSSATTTSNTGCNTAVRPNALQSCPVHCVDRSMQTSHRSIQQPTNKQQKEEAAVAGSPVYVFYPNYTLPDLAFLHHHKVDLDKVLLTPLKYSPNLPPHPALAHHKPLPRHHVTRHDIDQLKQKGLGHVMDWSSLTPLLPSECWSVLAELPQLKRHSHSRFDNTRPQFTVPATKDRQSPVPTEVKVPKGSVDSGVSDGTSGYRGSSTLLSESSETKQSNPLYVYDYSWTNEPVTPHKLKSNPELNKIDNKEKRLSMFEFTASILDDVFENNSVSKFLKGHNRKLQDHQKTPPNSPINQKSYQVNPNNLNDFYLGQAERIRESPDYENRKESLVEGVVCGVERLLSQRESAAEAALGSLCPALYALMSDGLKTNIDTPFGPINNSVWQVVEASAHQGLVTKALNDLVMKLNCEDVLSEGLIKFNAFIFGLLNVGGVEAWVSYMRTRESVLRKHYNPESVLLQASQGQALSRALTDRIISGLRPLSQIHFSLDLLYETKLLHTSLLQLMRVPVSPTGSTDSESALVRKIVQSLRCCGLTNQTCSSCEQNYEMSDRRRRGVRPRSCVEVVGNSGEAVGSSRKRWSGVAMGSRLASAFDSLAEGSSPTSSPEESTTQQNHGTGKFKSLQRKWELLSNKTSLCSPPSSPVKTSVNPPGSAVKSRIPRPVTSPVRPDVGRSRIPRASRADGVDRVTGVGRPSSLPQSRGPPPSHPSTTRRAASSSSTRPSKKTQPPNNRYVVTLTHRLPSDSGHLAFNEGERLRLVLEVDDTWLLCCRGDRKGLVPRSAVI